MIAIYARAVNLRSTLILCQVAFVLFIYVHYRSKVWKQLCFLVQQKVFC